MPKIYCNFLIMHITLSKTKSKTLMKTLKLTLLTVATVLILDTIIITENNKTRKFLLDLPQTPKRLVKNDIFPKSFHGRNRNYNVTVVPCAPFHQDFFVENYLLKKSYLLIILETKHLALIIGDHWYPLFQT